VTKEQALCMLYCEDYTEDNAATLQKRLNDVEDFELCYRDDPTDPVLVSKRKLFCNPFRYHRYASSSHMCAAKEDLSDATLTEMVKDFLNEVFLQENPHNDTYKCEKITVTEIQAAVSRYTAIFDDKSPLFFAQWCSKVKLDLSRAAVGRKIGKGTDGKKVRYRALYTLNPKLHGKTPTIL
ncbi:hypothetical protein BCR43DRAFT_448692, partial [Syncephalastrum racemosum]